MFFLAKATGERHHSAWTTLQIRPSGMFLNRTVSLNGPYRFRNSSEIPFISDRRCRGPGHQLKSLNARLAFAYVYVAFILFFSFSFFPGRVPLSRSPPSSVSRPNPRYVLLPIDFLGGIFFHLHCFRRDS